MYFLVDNKYIIVILSVVINDVFGIEDIDGDFVKTPNLMKL